MITRIESQPTVPVQHVNWFTTFQNCFAGRPTIRRKQQFSLLRVFSLAGLFVSVRCQLFPTTLELSSMNGTNGFTLNGDQAGDHSGYSVSNAGDVNGDGISDLLVGAPGVIGSGKRGKSYVIFGKPGLGSGGTIELSSLDGTNGFTLNGDQNSDHSGYSVSSAGDVNGDGVADLLIGALFADPAIGREQAGKSYVVFGTPSIGAGGTLELRSLDGIVGLILQGSQSNDESGHSVSSAGDVNGDGVSDLLIGAYRADPATNREDAGKSYVVLGTPDIGSGGILELSSLNGTNGFTFSGDQAHSRSGYSVSSAGDVNGDGVADLVIGAYLADPAIGREAAGKSYVVLGKAGLGISGTPELSSLNSIISFTLNGASANDFSGFSVSSAGDVNGDGVSDLLIGAPMASPDSTGRAYVVFGKQGLGSEGVLELSSLNGTAGFTLLGDRTQDQVGRSVSGAGDVNGDGISDLLIGAPMATPIPGRESAGQTYVVFGKQGLGTGGTLELSSLDGITGFILNGDQAGDNSGVSSSSAGDVNGDGISDLLIGAYNADPTTRRVAAGKIYVVFGRRPDIITRSSPQLESTATFRTLSTISRRSTAALANSSASPSPGLPLGIAGGVCAVISSIGAVVFAFRRCRQTPLPDPERQNPPGETVASQSLPPPNYGQLKLHPKCHTHYVGDEELQVFNREREQYESTKAVNASGYANLPQNQPSGYSDLEQLNREHDEYESARLTRVQANYDDMPK